MLELALLVLHHFLIEEYKVFLFWRFRKNEERNMQVNKQFFF